MAVPLSSVARAVVIVEGKPRFCGKVTVPARTAPFQAASGLRKVRSRKNGMDTHS